MSSTGLSEMLSRKLVGLELSRPCSVRPVSELHLLNPGCREEPRSVTWSTVSFTICLDIMDHQIVDINAGPTSLEKMVSCGRKSSITMVTSSCQWAGATERLGHSLYQFL